MAYKCKTFITTAGNMTGLKALDKEMQEFLDQGHKPIACASLRVPVSADRSSFQVMLFYEDRSL